MRRPKPGLSTPGGRLFGVVAAVSFALILCAPAVRASAARNFFALRSVKLWSHPSERHEPPPAQTRDYGLVFWRAWLSPDAIAEADWTDLIAAGYRPALARLLLGNLYLRRGETERAITVMKAEPDITTRLVQEGRTLLDAGRPQEAAARLRIAAALAPSNAETYRLLGSALWSEPAKAAEMLAAFHRYLDLHAMAGLDRDVVLGQVTTAEGRWTETEAAWGSVLGRRPDHPFANVFLGHALMRQGRCSDAIPVLQRAWERTHSKWAMLYAAQCRQQMGQLEEAEGAYLALLAVQPGDSDAESGLRQLRARPTTVAPGR